MSRGCVSRVWAECGAWFLTLGLLVWNTGVCLTGPVVADDRPAIGVSFEESGDHAYPPSAAVVDVTKPPYLAKGDGVTDDTAALQRALADVMGQHKILYLPAGTYRVSRTLEWSKKDARGQDAWGFVTIQGQNALKTIIRLADATFTDPGAPRAVMWCGGFGSADWFHNYIQDLTIDVGRENPGAIGLQFYSNNTGAVRNVRVRSADGRGAIGLDLGHRDMNGPLLVRNVRVEGFEVGVRTAASVNSQTFERLTLAGQTQVGFVNQGQSVSIRGLRSENRVTALRAESFTVLTDSVLAGTAEAREGPAIVLGPAPFLANRVIASGYRSVYSRTDGQEVRPSKGGGLVQGPGSAPFGAPLEPLDLPVRETPDVAWDDPNTWAIVDTFGADPNGQRDSSDAIQQAIDSGATTVFFPGAYNLQKPVHVRGKVRRLLGVGNWIDYLSHSKPDLIIDDGEAPLVVVEHFAPINGGIEVRTNRAVVFRSIEAKVEMRGTGDVFLEDVATSDLRLNPGQHVWARQLNIENEGTHLTNPGGTLWVLGYKTERGGTLLETRDKGSSEILGTFSYTTTAGKLAPMFVTENASVFAFFNEVCYSGDPFVTLVQESQGGRNVIVKREDGGLAPYSARQGAVKDQQRQRGAPRRGQRTTPR